MTYSVALQVCATSSRIKSNLSMRKFPYAETELTLDEFAKPPHDIRAIILFYKTSIEIEPVCVSVQL